MEHYDALIIMFRYPESSLIIFELHMLVDFNSCTC
jgi:hypothetical protein